MGDDWAVRFKVGAVPMASFPQWDLNVAAERRTLRVFRTNGGAEMTES